MAICDKINTAGQTLQSNLNARGVSCTYGKNSENKQTLKDMADLITASNLKGSNDALISISASRPYLLSGEKTDLIVTLKNGLGAPLANKSVTVSDGTSSYSGITNLEGLFRIFNISVSSDTTFTATYSSVSDSCIVRPALVCELGLLTSGKTWDINLNNADFHIDFIVHPTVDSGAIAYVNFKDSSNASCNFGDMYTNKNCGVQYTGGTFTGKTITTGVDTLVSMEKVGTTVTLVVGDTTYTINDFGYSFAKINNCNISNNSIKDLKLYLL